MPDAIYEHPRLAAVYDPLDPDRSDLDVYAAIVNELGATRVLDVGCGTGCFALLLAENGLEVVGVDPARASLDVARAKPGADRVHWIHGDATTLPPLSVDVATMTGNVAQAIVDDMHWDATLRGIQGHSARAAISSSRRAIRPARPGASGMTTFTRSPRSTAWVSSSTGGSSPT
jgi:SAM-dependent methyltransferase